jgi:hypothetical protein
MSLLRTARSLLHHRPAPLIPSTLSLITRPRPGPLASLHHRCRRFHRMDLLLYCLQELIRILFPQGQ